MTPIVVTDTIRFEILVIENADAGRKAQLLSSVDVKNFKKQLLTCFS